MLDPASSTIAANLRGISDRITAAAIAAGRQPQDVTLIAVSKTKPAAAVEAALAADKPCSAKTGSRKPPRSSRR